MKMKRNLLPRLIDGKRLYRTPREATISAIVLHYISAVNIDKSKPFDIGLIYDIFKQYKYSAHYIIERNGDVLQLVEEKNVAFHAGRSSLFGRNIKKSCNDFSIGIELVGGQWIDFTSSQYDSLIILVKDLKDRYKIPKKNIVGHSDIAPDRKFDPGKHFDWNKLFGGLEKVENDSMKEKNKRLVIAEKVKIALIDIKEKKIPLNNNISTGDISFLDNIKSWFARFFNKE